MDKLLLVGFGEILWDMLPGGKRLGGAPANFAYHAHSLGHCGIVASAVGNDELGNEIIANLSRQQIDTSHISILPDKKTGTVTVEVDGQGQPKYVIHENVAWDFIPSTNILLQTAAKADAVCFGSLVQRWPVSSQALKNFLANVSPKCLRIFDINLRPPFIMPNVIKSSLALCNVLKLNDQELPVLAEMFNLPSEPLSALQTMIKMFGLKMIALTRGADGSLLVTTDEVSDLPGSPVKVVDTVGAGDSFTAAIVVGLLQHLSLKKIHNRAAKLAAYVCTQQGATPPMPLELLDEFKI